MRWEAVTWHHPAKWSTISKVEKYFKKKTLNSIFEQNPISTDSIQLPWEEYPDSAQL